MPPGYDFSPDDPYYFIMHTNEAGIFDRDDILLRWMDGEWVDAMENRYWNSIYKIGDVFALKHNGKTYEYVYTKEDSDKYHPSDYGMFVHFQKLGVAKILPPARGGYHKIDGCNCQTTNDPSCKVMRFAQTLR